MVSMHSKTRKTGRVDIGSLVVALAFMTVAQISSAHGANALVESCRRAFNADGPVAVSLSYDPYLVRRENLLLPLNGFVQVDLVNLSAGTSAKTTVIPYQDLVMGFDFASVFTEFHDDGLSSVYDAEARRMTQKTLDEIKFVEPRVPRNRQSAIVVYDASDLKRVVGFFRVFDGSQYQLQEYLPIDKFTSDPSMPLELIARLNSRTVPAVEQDRAAHKSIFELGKAYVAKSLTGPQRVIVRSILQQWMRKKILAPEQDGQTVYYIDVATEFHRELYEQSYGFAVITDPKLNGGVLHPDYIMRADLETIRKHLAADLD